MNSNRILIFLGSFAQNNGIANCIMNSLESICSNYTNVDFLVLRRVDSIYEKKVLEKGFKIFVLPDEHKKLSLKKISCAKYLFKTKYDLIHVNVPYHNGFMVLLLAWLTGVKVRIYHSHARKFNLTFKNNIYSSFFNMLCTRFSNKHLSCSDIAGKEIFGKQAFEIFHNSIYADKFIFSKELRSKLRTEIGVENSIVVGAVGRFDSIKNPFFLVDVFFEIKKMKSDAELVWLGEGPLEQNVKEYINKKGLTSSCHLMGSCSNVNEWYSAMDILLFPSLLEGFGMVLVEAQASGLCCFASDKVPEETKITDDVHFISLTKNADEWAMTVVDSLETCKNERASHLDILQKNGYDINSLNRTLSDIYAGSLKAE